MRVLLETFSTHLRERFSSPLMASFLLSWPVWNYKFVLVFFSDMKPYVKFSYISGQVYSNEWSALLYGLGGPLLTAILYVGVYPFIVYASEFVTNWHRHRLEAQRIKNNDETPLSEERAKHLRQELRAKYKSIEDDNYQQAELIKKTRIELAAIEQLNKNLEASDFQLKTELALLEKTSKIEQGRMVKLSGQNAELKSLLRIESSAKETLSSEKESLCNQLDAEVSAREDLLSKVNLLITQKDSIYERCRDLESQIDVLNFNDSKNKSRIVYLTDRLSEQKKNESIPNDKRVNFKARDGGDSVEYSID